MAIDVRSLIIAEAQRQGVDPGIAVAVASIESGICQWVGSPCNSDAAVKIGAAGEVGLFQLMPATAAGLGVDPYDLNQNIQGGIAYLRQMYTTFGNWKDAVAAYNCGPGCVRDVKAGKRTLPASTTYYQAWVMSVGATNSAALNLNAANQTTAVPGGSAPFTSSSSTSSLFPILAIGFIAAAVVIVEW
jgi:soluble lytic murein transglycosylase-like protein